MYKECYTKGEQCCYAGNSGLVSIALYFSGYLTKEKYSNCIKKVNNI